MKAVRRHTGCKWVLLYLKRWLEAPVRMPDGTLAERDRGTPQGAVVSPVLANLFLHYVFDLWMRLNHPDIPFERYADDAICHCRSEVQAWGLRQALEARFAECALRMHPEKSKILYCKDANRPRDLLGAVVRLPRIYLSTEAGDQPPRRTVCRFPSGSQQEGRKADAARRAPVAAASPKRSCSGRSCCLGSPGPHRLGALPPQILPLEALGRTAHDRCLHRSMGGSQIQAVRGPHAGDMGVVTLAQAAQPTPVRSLGFGINGWMTGA